MVGKIEFEKDGAEYTRYLTKLIGQSMQRLLAADNPQFLL